MYTKFKNTKCCRW